MSGSSFVLALILICFIILFTLGGLSAWTEMRRVARARQELEK